MIGGVTPLTITHGASVIDISGTSFQPASRVAWDGKPVPSVYVGSSLLRAKLPAQAPGPHLLTVTTPDAPIGQLRVAVVTDQRYLHVSGTGLADTRGNIVQLRGFNLGSWLVTESWMDGSTGTEGRGGLDVLEARFGAVRAGDLIDEWRRNWITRADLDLLQTWGANALRVPLDYRNLIGPGAIDATGNLSGAYLVRDPATGIITTSAGLINFAYLDWIVAQARRRGMYVIFDLHVWEGQLAGPANGAGTTPYQQISCDCTGAAAERQQAGLLWTLIAEHFKGNGTIAGMDVINEPNGSPGDTVQHVLFNAVLAGDPARVGFIEWSNIKNFAQAFPNAAYSTHYPPVMTASWAAQNLPTGVPVYMGEIMEPDAATAAALAQSLNRFGFSWTVWAYKGVNVGDWAMFDYYSGVAAVNPATSAYAAIASAWGTPLLAWETTGQKVNSYVNADEIAAYRAAMR